jgi:YD repeat-containing protein
VVAKAMGKGVEITGTVFKEGGRVAEKAGENLGTTGDPHEEADSKAAGLLGKLHPEANTPESGHTGGIRPPTEVGTGGGGSSARDHIGDDHRGAAIGEDHRTTTADPVDLATGEVLLTQTDIQLAGVLPLILRRTHLSSYRVDRWFGSSWASTLDQRVEVDDQGVVFVAADGSLPLYPTPGQNPVLPAEGARWPLRRTESGYAVDKPETGESLHFDAEGNPVEHIDALGGVTATEFGGFDVPVARTDQLGRRTVFGYDGQLRLTTLTNPAGLVWQYQYDAVGNLVAGTDFNGRVRRYQRDTAGRETSRWFGAAGLTLTWDGDNRLRTQAVTAPGPAGRQRLVQRRAYTYRADDPVTSIVDQLAGITEFDLDPAGKVTAAVSPILRERYGYDGSGNVTGPGRSFAGTLLRTAGNVRVEHDGVQDPVWSTTDLALSMEL